MPFRCLTYVAELFNNLVENKQNLYKKDLIKLPTPNFFVFYDGDESEQEMRIMKLSDAFEGDSSSLELVVHSININLPMKAEILNRSKFLKDYSTLIFYVKQGLRKKLNRRESIRRAIEECFLK